jgi:hypothetical protein
MTGTPVTANAVTIFVRLDKEQFIIAPMHVNAAGIYYEQREARVILEPTAEELGIAFRNAFNTFSAKDEDLRNRRTSDWPAYRASGMQSVSQFERGYCRIFCGALNSANVIVRASAAHPQLADVELSIPFNPASAEDVGKRILQLIDAVWALRRPC